MDDSSKVQCILKISCLISIYHNWIIKFFYTYQSNPIIYKIILEIPNINSLIYTKYSRI